MLEPTINQSKHISPVKGIRKARDRYNYILSKKIQTAEKELGKDDSEGNDDSVQVSESEECDMALALDESPPCSLYRAACHPSPSHDQLPAGAPAVNQDPLSALLSSTFEAIVNRRGHHVHGAVNTSTNRNDGSSNNNFVRIAQLVEFGNFLGLKWDQDVPRLKTELLNCGLTSHSSHLEFKSIIKLDHDMFVSFVYEKCTHQDFHYPRLLNLVEGFLTFHSLSDNKKELLKSAVQILSDSKEINPTANSANVDYLHVFRLASCLKKGFSWDDCSVVKVMMLESDDHEVCRQKILLGFLSRFIESDSDNDVADKIRNFRRVLDDLGREKSIAGPNLRKETPKNSTSDALPTAAATGIVAAAAASADDARFAAVTAAATSATSMAAEDNDSVSAGASHHAASPIFTPSRATASQQRGRPYSKASSKCTNIIRAAFRMMPKNEEDGGVEPKLVSHFGQFMGKDWILTYNESKSTYVLDGDQVEKSMSEHAFTKFCGRRLASMDDKMIVDFGKGYLAAARGSKWRRKVLDGVLRILLCTAKGAVELGDLFHFGKCLDTRFSVEDCQLTQNRVNGVRNNKNIRRSQFEGIFCYLVDKFNMDDGALTTAAERFVESVNSSGKNLDGKVASSRAASIALLKMDLKGSDAPKTSPFTPSSASIDFSFSERQRPKQEAPEDTFLRESSFVSQVSHSVNETLASPRAAAGAAAAPSPAEAKRAIKDLHAFIEKAKAAKESVHKMRIRDEHIKKGYLSSADRQDLFGTVPPTSEQPISSSSSAPCTASVTKRRKRTTEENVSLIGSSVAATKTGFRFRNTFLQSAAATLIQAEVRRRLARSNYTLWLSCRKIQRWWRAVMSKLAMKALLKFGKRCFSGFRGGSEVIDRMMRQERVKEHDLVQEPEQ